MLLITRFASLLFHSQARAARDALNAIVPTGESIPMVVKYADSPEEKQRKVVSLLAVF